MTHDEMLKLAKNAVIYRVNSYGSMTAEPVPATIETAIVTEVSKAEGAGIETMVIASNGRKSRTSWDGWHLTERAAWQAYHAELAKSLPEQEKAVKNAQSLLAFINSEKDRVTALLG